MSREKDFRAKRMLGRTGLMVSRIGIAASYGIQTAPVEKAFHEHGVNFLYWGSYRTKPMAEAIRNIARTDRSGLVVMMQSYDHLGFWIRRSVERGLRTLDLDQVEILLLGWFNSNPSRRIIDSCLKLKQEGKIRFIGVSGHNRRFHGELLRRADSPFDLQMFRYNAAHRGTEQDILPFVPAVNAPGLLAYTATRWGALLKEKKMPAGEKPLSASDCYRFVLSNPAMDICLTGPANADQLDEAVRTLDRGPLSPDELDRVRRIGDHVHGKSRLFI